MERHISIIHDLKSLWKMVKVFREERPEIVHSMTPKAGLITMMAGWLCGVPVRVHTFTGLVWPTAAGLKRRILMATDWLTCACATHIIPEGQGVLNDLKNGGITKKPMKVLGYGNVRGVDMVRFSPSRFDVSKNPSAFTFVFVGRIVGDKGINELVEAFVKLHDKHQNARLILVGSYEDELDPLSDTTREQIEPTEPRGSCVFQYVCQLFSDRPRNRCRTERLSGPADHLYHEISGQKPDASFYRQKPGSAGLSGRYAIWRRHQLHQHAELFLQFGL